MILRSLSLSVLVVLCLMPLLAAETTFHPAPHFTGTTLPTPPQQHAPWTPPTTTLPAAFVSATTTLFDQGLADPRGCEYRVIEVGTMGLRGGDGGVRETHGWVLPAQPGTDQRFAVCWDGLVYPVVAVTLPADLNADMQVAGQAYAEMRHQSAGDNATVPQTPPATLPTELRYPKPLQACLLLRLGQEELARQIWTEVTSGPYQQINTTQDPYLTLIRDWTMALYSRAVTAHAYSDDQLSLISARTLTDIKPFVEPEMVRRGLFHPTTDGLRSRRMLGNDDPLGFLGQLPMLLADEERRVQHPRPVPFNLHAVLKEPKKAVRIARLIDGLDEVAARQMMWPGSVNLAGDPITHALIKEGEDAVTPLIAVIDSDTRLVRSVNSGGMGRGGTLLTVEDAALAAIRDILQTNKFGDMSAAKDCHALAALLRDYWAKNQGITPEERLYRTLADDHATPAQWAEATARIVQPADETHSGGWVSTPPHKPGEVIPMRGAALRTKTTPTVSELMAKRARQIAQQVTQESPAPVWTLQQAIAIADNLQKWDSKAALPVLQDIDTHTRALIAPDTNTIGEFAWCYLAINQKRMGLHDEGAFTEYAAWLRGITLFVTSTGNSPSNLLEPLWRYHEHPAMQAAAQDIFSRKGSPWIPLTGQLYAHGNSLDNLLNTPMLGVSAFRSYLYKEFADTTPLGTVTFKGDGRFDMVETQNIIGVGTPEHDNTMRNTSSEGSTTGQVTWRMSIEDATVQLPPAGTELPLRRCDLFAWKLSDVSGLPQFEPYWTIAQRDAAIATLKAVLTQYGDRYRFNASLPKDGYVSPWQTPARMSLPHLDHPATANDVQQGWAIFTLASPQRRLVHLSSLPLKASWTTLKKYPTMWSQYDAKTGKTVQTLHYDQDGWVWQAEEVLEHGVWVRYYGFVGKHELAKVPANEIEFPAENRWQWGNLSCGLDCQLSRVANTFQITKGHAALIDIQLRNRTGMDLQAPTELVGEDADHHPALRKGVALHMRYTPVDFSQPLGNVQPTYVELSPKSTAIFTPGASTHQLAPTEAFTVGRVDLRDWFDMTQPGTYQCWLTFSKDSGLGEGRSGEVQFVVSEP